jgi:hypothetical protein
MTDRELLELAAKAAGIEGRWMEWHEPVYGSGIVRQIGAMTWNPLTDDGDALRLTVKLKLDIEFYEDAHKAVLVSCKVHGEKATMIEPMNGEGARRAIVRTAAEIGRAMKWLTS